MKNFIQIKDMDNHIHYISINYIVNIHEALGSFPGHYSTDIVTVNTSIRCSLEISEVIKLIQKVSEN